MTAPGGFARERHLDVRDDIERGAEPFARIVAAAGELGPDETLVLHVPFEPVPLYRVLGAKGFTHRAERQEPGHWRVWFSRQAPASTAGPEAAPGRDGPGPAGGEPRVVRLDVRGTEPEIDQRVEHARNRVVDAGVDDRDAPALLDQVDRIEPRPDESRIDDVNPVFENLLHRWFLARTHRHPASRSSSSIPSGGSKRPLRWISRVGPSIARSRIGWCVSPG